MSQKEKRSSSGAAGSRLAGLIVARLLSPLTSFVIAALVARLWGTSQLGQLHTILSWFALFQFVCVFGIAEYISREIGKEPTHAAKYFCHALYCIVATSVLCVPFMVGARSLFDYDQGVRSGIAAISVALPFGAGAIVCHAVLTAFGRIQSIALISALESLVLLACAVFVIANDLHLVLLIWGVTASRVISAGASLWVVARLTRPVEMSLDIGFLKIILPPALVFGLTGVSFQVFMRAGALMLSAMEDMESVGLFGSASKLAEMCLMLPIAFYVLNLPAAAYGYKTHPESMEGWMLARARTLALPAFVVFVFGFTWAEQILQTMYGQRFDQAAWTLRILLIAFIVQCAEIVLGMCCQAAGYHRFTMYVSLLRALCVVVANAFLIPMFGVEGAAGATLAAILISFVVCARFARRTLHRIDWRPLIVRPAVVSTVALALLYPCAAYINVVGHGILYVLACALLFSAWQRARPMSIVGQ